MRMICGFVMNALKAKVFYHRDVQYIVRNGKAIIINEDFHTRGLCQLLWVGLVPGDISKIAKQLHIPGHHLRSVVEIQASACAVMCKTCRSWTTRLLPCPVACWHCLKRHGRGAFRAISSSERAPGRGQHPG